MVMSRVIGIDLGTTNSCVAVLEGDVPTVIANKEGYRTTPSVVAFAKDKTMLVGDPARRQAAVNAERTIFSIKRHMGSDYRKKIDGKAYYLGHSREYVKVAVPKTEKYGVNDILAVKVEKTLQPHILQGEEIQVL